MIKNFLSVYFRHPFHYFISQRACATLNSFTWRTHTCGELNANHTGEEVTICGWKSFHRCDKFMILRDAYGYTQVIIKENEPYTKKYLDSLPLESVIQVKGVVQKRPRKDVNAKLPTGEIEVQADEIKLLNPASPKIPITSKDQDKVTETVNYKYRYLYLRKPKMQQNLRTRSQVLMKIRKFLHDQNGFVEIETPTLFRKTPGGAKEFIVPTKFPGLVYSLTQSPQQLKQLSMAAGFDRYFQIARCYRNEGTKSDRQPEFTQVDIELSLTTADLVRSLVESMLKFCWPEDKGLIKIPFNRITYEESMKIYGTDKPDLRFEVKIEDLKENFKGSNLRIATESSSDSNSSISCIVLPRGSKLIKKSFINELQSMAESQNITFIPIFIKGDYSWSSSISKHVETDIKQKINEKLLIQPDDLILLASGKKELTQTVLGKARIQCAEFLQSIGVNIVNPSVLSFVWVTDFPLFLKNEDGNLESAHHPFTAPQPEDEDLIYTDPLKAKSQHYDLVLNGQEIGGGSIRIIEDKLQKYVLEDILKEDSTQLQHMLEALGSGCPPHGGIALGIDRIIAIMCGCRSITDVIAFPKSSDGKDLMSGAPSKLSYEDKKLYHIEPVLNDK